MALITTLIFTVLALTPAVLAMTESDNQAVKKHPTCQTFTQGLTFNDSQAIGTWHLLYYKNEYNDGSGDSRCLQFTPTSDQEKKFFKELIGKYVENFEWENLTLKMQIPCDSLYSDIGRNYYLRRDDNDGSYTIMLIPHRLTPKMDLSDFYHSSLRLKMIEGQYLVMMECHEKYVLILDKQPRKGNDLEEQLKKMIEVYWQ